MASVPTLPLPNSSSLFDNSLIELTKIQPARRTALTTWIREQLPAQGSGGGSTTTSIDTVLALLDREYATVPHLLAALDAGVLQVADLQGTALFTVYTYVAGHTRASVTAVVPNFLTAPAGALRTLVEAGLLLSINSTDGSVQSGTAEGASATRKRSRDPAAGGGEGAATATEPHRRPPPPASSEEDDDVAAAAYLDAAAGGGVPSGTNAEGDVPPARARGGASGGAQGGGVSTAGARDVSASPNPARTTAPPPVVPQTAAQPPLPSPHPVPSQVPVGGQVPPPLHPAASEGAGAGGPGPGAAAGASAAPAPAHVHFREGLPDHSAAEVVRISSRTCMHTHYAHDRKGEGRGFARWVCGG
jgi:hypothetical protein